jgi:cysteinyl-tRNA synthetase
MHPLFQKFLPATISDNPIYLFNTLSGKKERFTPLKTGRVLMYTCGPTVYDYVHIGNLMSFIFADTLKRTLRYHGYHVEHTMNLTDFGHLTDDADAGEDKMMKGLRREGKPITLQAMRDLADEYIEAFIGDLDALNMLPPDHLTRASDYVREQIALIETLESKGYTYETRDGIYFDIEKFPAYGKLGNVDLNKLKEGARVEVNPEKRHPADFALWKKGLLGWESHWGKGFPGWHIECTAMAFATLGKQIDVHTGGEDLKYTHHNGEIAQAEAATGKSPYVAYWFHSAFMTIDGTKISKSLGNTIALRNLEDRGYSPDAYRYWVLTSHYRSQTNFSFEALDGAKQALFRLKRYLVEEYRDAEGSVSELYRGRFMEAIADDLNTPKAVALLWELVKDAQVPPGDKAATLRSFDEVLGIGLTDERDDVVRELGIVRPEELPVDIQELLDKRDLARTTHNWEEADRIREALNLKGYVVEDTPQGQRISKTSL